MEELFVNVAGNDPVWQGLAGGVVITFLNLIGALAIFVVRNPSERLLDTALGFAGGVMLAASFTSLILPGIEEYGGLVSVMIGVALGALVLDRSDAWMPYVYRFITGRVRGNGNPDGGATMGAVAGGVGGGFDKRTAAVLLFIVAITLHNMPEGLAVGVGFGSGNTGNAIALMLAIGLQNIPEGLAVAIGARDAGLGSLSYAAITGIRAGLVEIPLALFGAAVVVVAEPVLPYAMGFAAGGMLYVITHEIMPQTHSRGNERLATLGTIVGLIVMLTLDVALA